MEVARARVFALKAALDANKRTSRAICTRVKAFAIALVGRAAEADASLKTARVKIGALEEAARTSKGQLQSLHNEKDTLTTARQT
jgi:hypothetical protein